ncbi:aminotransferase class V-fold PLP-dependent enzyme [Leucobacter coleopterorum]|uniref:Aminotransferase class V-fold PLP-dependent enzyme n=1 Tax=Leucobacter coleopterorum TaxID=2714933 RepID=A0ABX6JUR4_9MICO|nr:aminotransferase class V-fold PLP-dependent enzyme [Leucobacter coleopterorum]QIM18041.1 aminotransferase class V-fold PLP-dependent enzyme [Leucobacter coleopterorum]
MPNTPLSAEVSFAHAPYAEALVRHAEREPVSLLVPGHLADGEGAAKDLEKLLGKQTLGIDVTGLLSGIDLGPNSPRIKAEQLASEAWGARRTWFMTNGSSQGNKTAALAVGQLGRDIVLQRSAHSSIIDGVIAAGLRSSFVIPSIDMQNGIAHCVTAESVKQAITAHPGQVTAVYVVSPSYFGAVADIPAIADVVHAAGAALIVDCAWGAHFGFHPDLPASPVKQGADIVIMSTHKMATSLHQSAVIHLGDTALADELEPLLDRAYRMTASTSESSLLLASIDVARKELQHGGDRIKGSLDLVTEFREQVRTNRLCTLIDETFVNYPDIVAFDPLRIPLDVTATGMTGHDLRLRLAQEKAIWVEMSTQTTIVPLVGAGKRPKLDRLLDVITQLAGSRAEAATESAAIAAWNAALALPEPGIARKLPREAFFAKSELVAAEAAIGRISADSLAAYPPGIPNLLPGEEVTAETVRFLRAVAQTSTGYVRGAADPKVSQIRVVAD